MSGNVSKPMITAPRALQRAQSKYALKARAKQLEAANSKYSKGERNLPALIQCRRQELNHFKNQQYSPFKKLPMASEHWVSRRTIGDFFAFAPYRGSQAETWYKYVPSPYDNLQFAEGDPVLKIQNRDKPTFDELGLNQKLLEAMKRMGFKTPTNTQHEA